jgi:hypothetical protein
MGAVYTCTPAQAAFLSSVNEVRGERGKRSDRAAMNSMLLVVAAAAAVLGAAEALPRSGGPGKVEVKFFAEAL